MSLAQPPTVLNVGSQQVERARRYQRLGGGQDQLAGIVWVREPRCRDPGAMTRSYVKHRPSA